MEVIVTLVKFTLTQKILILVLVHPLAMKTVNTLIKVITIPTNTITILLIPTLIAVLRMTNIIKIHTLIPNPTTLLLSLLLDITPTLVIVLIVVILEISLALSNPIKLHIASFPIIDPVLTLTLNHNFNPLLFILNLPLLIKIRLKLI